MIGDKNISQNQYFTSLKTRIRGSKGYFFNKKIIKENMYGKFTLFDLFVHNLIYFHFHFSQSV